jgi:hypothetical protein
MVNSMFCGNIEGVCYGALTFLFFARSTETDEASTSWRRKDVTFCCLGVQNHA